MPAAEYNITVSQNANFDRGFQLKESGVVKDLSGFTIAGKIKRNYNDATSTSFTTTINNAATGLFSIALTDTDTTALAPGDQVYDVTLTETATGTITRLLQGKCFVSPGVS